jgi:hypothetical protein
VVQPSGHNSGRQTLPTKRTLVAADPRSPTPERPARQVDPKGKRREEEPVAGPSRHVTETVVPETRIEVEADQTSRPGGSNIDSAPLANPAVDSGRSARAAEVSTASASGAAPAAVTADHHSTTDTAPKKKRKRVKDVEVPPNHASTLPMHSISRRHETPVNADGDRPTPGSTPLRQEIERSNEKRRREQHRKSHGHGPSSRRLSKRAMSPDKVYAYVNLPPPRPVVVQVQEVTPEPLRRRTPPRQLTPAEREQSVQAGSRIVQDIAAQYRLRVAALGKKFGVGIKEISAATNEVKRRNGGKSAVDWNMLEMVLQEQYGR